LNLNGLRIDFLGIVTLYDPNFDAITPGSIREGKNRRFRIILAWMHDESAVPIGRPVASILFQKEFRGHRLLQV
jgi:hypothetical protein